MTDDVKTLKIALLGCGSVGSQVLTCSYGNMAPGASALVHISSGTSSTCNQTLKNTANPPASWPWRDWPGATRSPAGPRAATRDIAAMPGIA